MASAAHHLWDPESYTFMLRTPEEIDALAAIWDAWIPIVPISDYARIHVGRTQQDKILRDSLRTIPPLRATGAPHR